MIDAEHQADLLRRDRRAEADAERENASDAEEDDEQNCADVRERQRRGSVP